VTAYLISPVKLITQEERGQIEQFISAMKIGFDWDIYFPADDTDQTQGEFSACIDNLAATKNAEFVLIWFRPDSLGSILDLGFAMALGKPVILVNEDELDEHIMDGEDVRVARLIRKLSFFSLAEEHDARLDEVRQVYTWLKEN